VLVDKEASMALGRAKVASILTDDERVQLDSLAHRSPTAPHLARRARIILACGEGQDAVVFCVDESAQIQPLDLRQTVLPLRPGQVERRTHDHRRHGTTTLFAALNVKTSALITQFHQRHRSTEFRQFLDTVAAAVPRYVERAGSWDGALVALMNSAKRSVPLFAFLLVRVVLGGPEPARPVEPTPSEAFSVSRGRRLY
jgi:hypothetical protein